MRFICRTSLIYVSVSTLFIVLYTTRKSERTTQIVPIAKMSDRTIGTSGRYGSSCKHFTRPSAQDHGNSEGRDSDDEAHGGRTRSSILVQLRFQDAWRRTPSKRASRSVAWIGPLAGGSSRPPLAVQYDASVDRLMPTSQVHSDVSCPFW